MYRFLSLVILLVFYTSQGLADLAIEPYTGVNFYHDNSVSSQSTDYFSFPTLGVKVGVNAWGVTLGVDLNYAPTFPISSSKNLIELCVKEDRMSEENCYQKAGYQAYHILNIGPTISLKLPFIVDAYGSAFFSQALNRHYRLSGFVLKTGASYLTIPLFSLNFEFQVSYFTQCFDVSLQKSCDFQSPNIPQTLMGGIISISMPIRTVL